MVGFPHGIIQDGWKPAVTTSKTVKEITPTQHINYLDAPVTGMSGSPVYMQDHKKYCNQEFTITTRPT